MGIRIAGMGGYVPSRTVTNFELARTVDTSDEWIVAKTGIRERRFAGPDEAPSDMGYRAALRCLEDAKTAPSAIDLIVVASATPDQSQPAVACLIQERLGIGQRHVPAFDVHSVCAGFVFALDVAQSMMLASPGRYRRALVVGTDAFSKILNFEDRRTCVFFGDGAGAVLLEHCEGGAQMHFRLGSDGRGSGDIQVPAGGTRKPVTPEVLAGRQNTFMMNGPKVWDFGLTIVPSVIRALLGDVGLAPHDADLVILHQSNLRMIEAIMAQLDLPMDRAVTTVETYGNTAAASVPLTLVKARDTGALRPGKRVVLCGFGGGLSWGVALLEWDGGAHA
jgi:3-oxoacyl-[acyl-carrier-protein] synthase-3